MEHIAYTPLYFIEGCIVVWQYAGATVPHPTWPEIIRGSVMFACLYPVRIVMNAVIPEKKAARQVRRRFIARKKAVPTKTEHQAAASITSLLH